MKDEFVYERLIKLRTQAGCSARDMSISLGQNESYINRIENKKSLPSLSVLFLICEYLGITPKEFFDDSIPYPPKLNGIVEDLKHIDDAVFDSLAVVVKELAGKKIKDA